jgi:hypothetical protein
MQTSPIQLHHRPSHIFKGVFGPVRLFLCMLVASCFVGCGDLDGFDSVEPQSDDQHVSVDTDALRQRPSKLCNCPPETRVFYSPAAEPDCSWVCRRLDEPKRISHNDDAKTETRDAIRPDGRDGEQEHEGVSERRTQRQSYGPPSVAAAPRECITVCPDWTIIGPHPCSHVPECLSKEQTYIDVSAGGSSVLDTRSAPSQGSKTRRPSKK